MPSTSPAAGVATEPPRCSQRRVRIGRAPSDPRNHRERELKLRRDNPPPPPSRGGEQLCSRNRFILLLTLLLAQPWLCPRRVTRGHELCQGIDTGGEAGGEGLFAPVRSLGVTVARLTFSPPAGGLGVSPAWHGRAESSSIQPGCKSRTEAPDPTHAEPRGHRSSPSLAVGETGLSPPQHPPGIAGVSSLAINDDETFPGPSTHTSPRGARTSARVRVSRGASHPTEALGRDGGRSKGRAAAVGTPPCAAPAVSLSPFPSSGLCSTMRPRRSPR